MMKVLKVENLNKSYPEFKLENVSFEIEEGTIMGFVGKNGAGKSTTIKAILNMIHSQSGRVEILGKNFNENESEIKAEIGVVLGGIDFYGKKKLKSIKNSTKQFYGDKWDDEKYAKYMKAFEIDENKKADELSSGMRVKYMIVLALSHDAKLLILDEPTSGLDPVSRDDLCNLFRHLVKNGERSIFFSTHITSDLEKCATDITFIKDGKIVNSLPMNKMMEHYSYLKQDGKTLTLEDIIVSVERRDYDDKIFD